MKNWEKKTWPSIGYAAIEYIETNCLHGLGPRYRQNVELTNSEKKFLLRGYQVHPPAFCGDSGCDCREEIGRWRYDWRVYSRIKGSRKSEFGSWIMLFELDGPCRFGEWDGYDLIPISHHDLGGTPDIICLATSEEQLSDTIWASFQSWITESPIIGRLDVNKDQVNHNYGGNARIRTSASISRDGGRTTFSACEETHLWITKELIELDKTNRRNLEKLAAANPWGICLTTMFKPGQRSVAETDWNNAFRDHERGILYDHVEAPVLPNEFNKDGSVNEPVMLESIRAAIDDSYWLRDRNLLRSIKRDPIDGQRYWLGRRSASLDMVVQRSSWDLNMVNSFADSGDIITLGFDGSETDDHTGLIATRVNDGFQWVAGYWIPDEIGIEAMKMYVEETLDFMFAHYNVIRFYPDPPYWQDDIARWKNRFGEKKVIPWWTQRENAMTWATMRWVTAINNGYLKHDGDPNLAEHVENCRRRDTRITVEVTEDEEGTTERKKGFVLRKEYRGSPLKIDLAVCSVLSWEARADAIAAGQDKVTTKSKVLRSY